MCSEHSPHLYGQLGNKREVFSEITSIQPIKPHGKVPPGPPVDGDERCELNGNKTDGATRSERGTDVVKERKKCAQKILAESQCSAKAQVWAS